MGITIVFVSVGALLAVHGCLLAGGRVKYTMTRYGWGPVSENFRLLAGLWWIAVAVLFVHAALR